LKYSISNTIAAALLCTIAPTFADAATATWSTLSGEAPKVIGHRGAPAYLPENSLPGYELAAEMDADVVETDVQLTRDGQLVVMHDSTLARTTDIATKFPPRNGNYYVSDFTLAEIKTLTLSPTGSAEYTYPGFTPSTTYEVPTLGELLDTLTAYNTAHGTDVGLLTEVKGTYSPEANTKVIEVMVEKGYAAAEANSSVQSFDFSNVEEMSGLIDAAGAELDVYQLGSAGLVGADWYVSGTRSLLDLAAYVDGVAVTYGSLSEAFISAAHDLGLEVFGWTFRPADLAGTETMIASFLDWGLDGFITDNSDLVGEAIAISGYGSGPAPVPLPASLPLLMAGSGAVAFVARRNKRTARAA